MFVSMVAIKGHSLTRNSRHDLSITFVVSVSKGRTLQPIMHVDIR